MHNTLPCPLLSSPFHLSFAHFFDVYSNTHHSSTQSPSSHNTSHNASHTTHKTHASTTNTGSAGNAGNPSPVAERAYTQEQLVAVQRVRKLKDYYAILEISKDASEADIKKAYRKVFAVIFCFMLTVFHS